ncbi:MAG: hypothetical protein AB7J40_04015 [Candidatus Altimarinota bacterium]
MTNEEQIIKSLEEIKQALRHIYGEGEQQDTLITNIEKNVKATMQYEIAKIQKSIDAISLKIGNMTKLADSLDNLIKMISKIDFSDMKSDIDRIRNQLITFESKLNNIDRKIR